MGTSALAISPCYLFTLRFLTSFSKTTLSLVHTIDLYVKMLYYLATDPYIFICIPILAVMTCIAVCIHCRSNLVFFFFNLKLYLLLLYCLPKYITTYFCHIAFLNYLFTFFLPCYIIKITDASSIALHIARIVQ